MSSFSLDVRSDLPKAIEDVVNMPKQQKYALMLALSRTAKDVKLAEYDEMKRVIDAPTAYTLNSLFVKPAKINNLEAKVWFKDERATSKAGTPATRFMSPHVDGGRRGVKRFEKALQHAGYMPLNWVAVPAEFAKLDANGNVSRGQIVQILSQLRVEQTAGSNRAISTDTKKRDRARKKAGGQYIGLIRERGKLRPGIYLVKDTAWGRSAPLPVFIFVPSARYDQRYDFDGVAERTTNEWFDKRFDEAFKEAMANARPDKK